MAERVAQGNRLSYKGAPSQHSQASRKGKRAWRKNVDIAEVENGLEELREEERVLGYAPFKQLINKISSIAARHCIKRQTKSCSRST